MEHLIRITTNFTGAALGGLGNFLLKSLKLKKREKEGEELSLKEITAATILIAKQYSIKFGILTLPEIYQSHSSQKFIFTGTFLERIAKNIMLVKHVKEDEFKITYTTEIQKYSCGKVTPIYEEEEDQITIKVENNDPFQSLENYLNLLFDEKTYELKSFRPYMFKDYNHYKKEIESVLSSKEKGKLKKKKSIFMIEDFPENFAGIWFDAKLFQRNLSNLYTIYYIPPGLDESALKIGNKNYQTQNYSGRIMVELNEENRMAF
jgi:hypothetical protein